MGKDAYQQEAESALRVTPIGAATFEISQEKTRNTAAAITSFLVERLRQKNATLRKVRNTTYAWGGGVINIRNAVNKEMWTNLRLNFAEDLHKEAAQRPVLYLMTCWVPNSSTLNAWILPESVVFDVLPRFPVEKTNPNKKTIRIKPETNKFEILEDSPDLMPFHVAVTLTKSELALLEEAMKTDTAAKDKKPAEVTASEEIDLDEPEASYTADTVAFLRELPARKVDPAWHKAQKTRFHEVLRDPTQSLLNAIRTGYIEPLDREVAGGKNQISILKKNDFGAGGYNDFYWFAFYDPSTGSRITSPQLFFSLHGDTDCWDFGFSMGNNCSEYAMRLAKVIRENAKAVADHLKTAPLPTTIELEVDGKIKELPALEWSAQLETEGTSGIGHDGDDVERITLRCKFPLGELVQFSATLPSMVGEFFRWAWPYFDASRSGKWLSGIKTRVQAIPNSINVNDVDIDEGAAETLEDLAGKTSLPREFLRDLEDAISLKHHVVLTGPPGTSKTYIAGQFARYFARGGPGRSQGQVKCLYVHANWTYEDFFEGLRPAKGSGFSFEPHAGLFLDWVDKQLKGQPSSARHVLILDELNRCDTAAVLGELLQLLEYPGETVPLISGRPFAFPRNLYVIGTMNSADRSVGRLDLALRRRFFWVDLLPQPAVLDRWLEKAGNNPIGFNGKYLMECNKLLDQKNIPKEQQVGHALFMGQSRAADDDLPTDIPLTERRLRQVVRFSVLPYLRELLTMNTGTPDEMVSKRAEAILLGCLAQKAELTDENLIPPTGS